MVHRYQEPIAPEGTALTWITCNMTSVASTFSRFSLLAILCACAVVVGCVAPMLNTAAGDASDLLDDLAPPVTASMAPQQPIVFPLNPARPVRWAWLCPPLFRPPIV